METVQVKNLKLVKSEKNYNGNKFDVYYLVVNSQKLKLTVDVDLLLDALNEEEE